MTIELVLTLGALALVDSTSFGTLGIPLYLLLASDRSPAGRLLVYLATVATFYFGVGVALMLGLGAALAAFEEALYSRTAYWIQLAIGVGLFLLSFRFDSKRQREKEGPSRWEPRLGGPGAMILLGLTAALLEVATMIPYLGAIGFMTGANLPAVQWVPLLAGYVLVMILPPLVLFGVKTVAGGRLDPKLERLRAWMRRHSASALGWTLGIVGFFVARDAASRLFGG
ncbi:GAP family protein [Streptosporangium sp. NPDC023825]|uniref:GAP family protein n=1 Tax=Streptosporangium sp. NPDC023825 TaxID=3154909 RepID=UPI00342980EA